MEIGILIIVSIVAIVLGSVIGYLVKNYLTQQQNQRMKSDCIALQ